MHDAISMVNVQCKQMSFCRNAHDPFVQFERRSYCWRHIREFLWMMAIPMLSKMVKWTLLMHQHRRASFQWCREIFTSGIKQRSIVFSDDSGFSLHASDDPFFDADRPECTSPWHTGQTSRITVPYVSALARLWCLWGAIWTVPYSPAHCSDLFCRYTCEKEANVLLLDNFPSQHVSPT